MCAPTAFPFAEFAATGGMAAWFPSTCPAPHPASLARPGVPWHDTHPVRPAPSVTVPSTCAATDTVVPVYPGWQSPHSWLGGCCVPAKGGGAPWQAVQASRVGDPAFQAGVALAPLPPVKLPWQ